MLSKKSVVIAVAAAAALTMPLVSLAASPAGAAQRGFHITKVLSTHFVGPLQIEVAGGSVFVADSFTSTLRKIGSKHVIARGPDPSKGGDLAGVAIDAAGHDLAYLVSNGSHSRTEFVVRHRGKQVLTRNLASWEAKHNPDGTVHYGVDHASSCARKALRDAHVPVSYLGHKDSHPYAVAFLGNHNWAVADAGGNDLLTINSATGRIATLAVLPRQPFTITKKIAAQNHVASCAVGTTYYSESVPTDVEAGPHAMMYVSTLPGGEVPGGGPRGRVYTVSPSGTVKIIGHGFADATNLAVTPAGVVYVAELSKGAIATIHNATPKTVFKLKAVAAVEWKYGELFAATAPAAIGAHGPGEVVKIQR